MKKEISPGVLIGVVAAVVLVAGFFLFKAIVGDKSDAPSDMAQQLTRVLEKSGGDPSKMSPEDKKIYDKAVETGYYRPYGMSGNASNYPGSGGPRSSASGPGNARMSGGYPGSSGGSGSYPGSSGGSGSYPGASGGSGNYPR